MTRKLDARAASFSPSFGALPPQQGRQELSAPASSGAAASSNQGGSSQSQVKSRTSAEESNGRNASVTRGGGGQSRRGRSSSDSSNSNRSTLTARPQQVGGGRGRGRVDSGGRGTRRRRGDSTGDGPAADDACTTPSRRSNADGGGRRSASSGGGGGERAGSGSGGFSVESGAASGGNTSKGRGKGGSAKGGNANHLLNFQFQPISNAAHQGEGGGGRARRGSGTGRGSGRSKAGGGGVWGGGSSRGPMSKEQFLQANFHFLLHNPAGARGDASSTPPVLQEAFFDPDVLVDWDTVDTVRLFRKVSKRKEALSPAGKKPTPVASSPCRAAASPASKASAGDALIPAPTGESTAAPRKTSSPEFDGLTVMPALEEISWGSGKKVRDSASSGVKAAGALNPPVQSQAARDATAAVLTSVSRVGANANGAPGGIGGARKDEEEDGDEGEWRCSICLGMPIVPRVTKCGHGPFCLVCILRHLNGEASARCPLCFDKMHRDQLRRVACQNVIPYAQGGDTSLLLLQRERSSLVPTIRAFASREDVGGGVTADVPSGSKGYLSGGAANRAGDAGEESWAAEVCPEEGHQSERFSRLVRAKPSTLRDLAAAEQFALLSFRHESIQSGETEWIPFVSEAQALVSSQLERFSFLPPSSPASPAARASRSRNPKERPTAAAASAGEDVRAGPVPIPRKLAGSTSSPKAAVKHEDMSVAERNDSTTSATAGSSDVESAGVGATSSTSAAAVGVAASEAGGAGGLFRFFQSCDGQKAFLHPLNMRQLLDDAEKGLPLPESVDAKVLEVETVKLTPELRRRLPFLNHIPIHCDVSFLEVDMAGLVSEETGHKFREEIQKRERKRRGRAAQEARAAKNEARLEQDRTDRIAAMREFTVDLQGPTPGGSEPPRPPPLPLASTSALNQDPGSSEGDSSGVEAGAAVAASSAVAGSGGGAGSSAPSRGAADGASRGNRQEATGWSFARVTAMNGHFPTLKPSANSGSGGGGGGGGGNTSSTTTQAVGAWGTASAVDGGSGREARVWGAKTNELLREAAADAVGDSRPLAERESGATQAGKKKGRKGKAVSLFSNAGVRGGAR